MLVLFVQRILPQGVLLIAFLGLLSLSPQAGAQSAASGGGSLIQGLMPLFLILAVFYFLLLRPHQKRQRQQRELMASLKRGNKILTNGGLYAVVTRVIDDRDIEVEIASKVKVRMLRSCVIELVGSPSPAPSPRR